MKLSRLELVRYRGFEQLTLGFTKPVTLLVGPNGSGKSTVLTALVSVLSWYVNRLGRGARSSGTKLRPHDEHLPTDAAPGDAISIALTIDERHVEYSWKLALDLFQDRLPKTKGPAHDLGGLNRLVEIHRKSLQTGDGRVALPVIAYYPLNRAVLDIPIRIRKRHEFDRLSAYQDALTAAANFRIFFEWFREREDYENEIKAGGKLAHRDTALKAVRQSIYRFLPGFSHLFIQRRPRLAMLIEKGRQFLAIDSLSDGEKCLLALVGDLARRFVTLNPHLDQPLDAKGIVLIDELELHLHPAWQRRVIPALRETFPNCQFVLTTHSPQVLGNAVDAVVYLLQPQRSPPTVMLETGFFGRDSNSLLIEHMGTLDRDSETDERIHQLFVTIDAKRLEEAQRLLQALQDLLGGDDPTLVRAEALIDRHRWMQTRAADRQGS